MPVADIPAGAVKRWAVPGRRALAVYNIDGAIFVTDDMCTHGMGSLSEGTLDGDVIECPWHGGAFYVRTGQPASLPCTEALRVYPVAIEDGFVCVDLPAPTRPRAPAKP